MPASPAPDGATRQVNFSDEVQEAEPDEPPKNPLYKSSRLKGYITLILASVINYSAARNSDKGTADEPTDAQKAYAESVALVSTLTSIGIFCAHLDRFTPLSSVWETAFGDGSVCELMIILFLVLWWTVATAVETSVRGIAGDGRGQYNLYYSTWGCCWTCYWTLERWLVAYGWASFKAFISSWPFRAPGWIAVCFSSFMSLMFYLDLYSNHIEAHLDNPGLAQHYSEVGDAQWQWILFVSAFTIAPSLCFIVVELFRTTSSEAAISDDNSTDSNNNNNQKPQSRFSMAIAASNARPSIMGLAVQSNSNLNGRRSSRQLIPQRQNPLPDKGDSAGGKGPLENILEGFCLLLLVLAWIPTVVVATTPGGAASLVGNSYFLTWMSTVFVMETFIWFVHDLRKGVHSALQVKEREYQKFQTEVVQKSRALGAKRMAGGSWGNDALDDIELDDIPPTCRMKLPVITTTDSKQAPQPPGSPSHSPNNNNHRGPYDWSSQEGSDANGNNKESAITPKNDNTTANKSAFSRTMSSEGDLTKKQSNVRARRRAVVMESNTTPSTPFVDESDGTLFFEAPMDLEDNDLEDLETLGM